MILAVVLLCGMGYAGYSANNYFTTPAEKLMNANVQALTRSEGSGGKNTCYHIKKADNYTTFGCATCSYVLGQAGDEDVC